MKEMEEAETMDRLLDEKLKDIELIHPSLSFVDRVIAQLDMLKSVRAKIGLLDAHFILLGQGSGRRVYDIGEGRALKLSLNPKGRAQSAAEIDILRQEWYEGCTPHMYRYSDDAETWLIVDRVEKARAGDFKRLLGVDCGTFYQYLSHLLPCQCGLRYTDKDQKMVNFCDNSEAIQRLCSLIGNFDLHIGELGNKRSWGVLNDSLVILDCGLTMQVFNEYYRLYRDGAGHYRIGQHGKMK